MRALQACNFAILQSGVRALLAGEMPVAGCTSEETV